VTAIVSPVLPPNRVSQLRATSDLTRSDVAARLGLKSERTVYRWESGESQIPDATKLVLADMFGVTVAHLMGWDREDVAA
jgi:DNA-binding transcriptional regulator YiaG